MAGHDTFRGCAFQTAFAVRLAFDVLEGQAVVLQVEGDTDVVDAAMEAEDRAVLRSVQAKTKSEPRVWLPGAIADVIKAWLEGNPGASETFDFVTDGQLGKGVSAELVPALQHLREGVSSADERDYLEKLGIDGQDEALKRVGIHSRLPSARDLLEQETLRLISFREQVEAITTEEARELVKVLFGELTLDSGEADRAKRRIDRNEIAEIVGVSVEALDAAGAWSQELEEGYRAEIRAEEPDPALIVLDLLGIEGALAPSKISKPTGGGAFPASALLDQDGSALLAGPAGAGKSTTLGQLAIDAAGGATLPVRLFVASYAAGSLSQLIRQSLEHRVGCAVASGSVDLLLSRDSTLVLLDGAGELRPEQRSSLIADVEALRAKHANGARFVFAARHSPAFTELGLRVYSVQGLDRDARIAIATAEDGERGPTECERIESELGSLVDNPLLFRLALGLRLAGVETDSRAGLFSAFVERLQERKEGGALSAQELSALERCAFEMRSDGLYSAEEWWWLETVASAREEQIERGLIPATSPSAAEVVDRLVDVGVVRRLGQGTELALLHDLFADWFAAEAVRKVQELPVPLPEQLEEAIRFLAEQGALDRPQLIDLATAPVAAAHAAAALGEQLVEPDLVAEIWGRLVTSFGPDLRERYESLDLTVSADGKVASLRRPQGQSSVLALEVVGRAPVSSISLAVDLWLGALRFALASPRRTRPAVANADQAELADQLAQASQARIEATAALIGDLLPDLRDRIEAEIGPLALRGWIAPPREVPIPIDGQGLVREHVLVYTSVPADPSVIAVQDAAEIPEADGRHGQAIAEYYLREAPAEAARMEVRKALQRMIPRFE